MKQKTVIQIWGTQDNGKSTTIKIIIEELQRHINPAHSYILPLPNGDRHAVVLAWNGFSIGIESMGDALYYDNLHTHLDELFLVHKCDIIICASRVYNDVVQYIEHLANANNYRIIKATNYRGSEPPFSQNDLNQISAQHIVLLIEQIMNGVI